jgi:hypothetical protein
VALHFGSSGDSTQNVCLLEDLARAIVSLARVVSYSRDHNFCFQKILPPGPINLCDYKFREGVPSRHIRISLIAIFTDHWVQSLEGNSASRSSDSLNMNDMNARELLTTLSSEISSLSSSLHQGRGDNQVSLKYLDVCVACVENIALMACDRARRTGTGRSDSGESF